jgi:hypothetical protein
MSAQARARDWSDDAEALLAALVEALGDPQGERGRSPVNGQPTSSMILTSSSRRYP